MSAQSGAVRHFAPALPEFLAQLREVRVRRIFQLAGRRSTVREAVLRHGMRREEATGFGDTHRIHARSQHADHGRHALGETSDRCPLSSSILSSSILGVTGSGPVSPTTFTRCVALHHAALGSRRLDATPPRLSASPRHSDGDFGVAIGLWGGRFTILAPDSCSCRRKSSTMRFRS